MQLDQAESMFRSAWKEEYEYHQLEINHVCIITDKDKQKSNKILENTKKFLSHLEEKTITWQVLCKDDPHSVQDLIDYLNEQKPDLIVSYRNLWHREKGLPATIGVYLDMLTQATDIPILVLPHLENKAYDEHLAKLDSVMVMTDHLSGDHRLVDYGVYFTDGAGTLYLTHIESEEVFDYYMDAISKIPDIPTEIARDELLKKLLKLPNDFIKSCITKINERKVDINIIDVVILGHAITDYLKLTELHQVDLLILNTKDGKQMAMHGIAYSIAVEFVSVPLLLL